MEASNLNTANADSPVIDLQTLLAEQKSQMEATMSYQSESAKLNLEFQIHKAATDRLNAMAAAIGSTSQQASQQLGR